MRKKNQKDFFAIKASRRPARRFAVLIYVLCYVTVIAPPLYFLQKNYQMMDEMGYKFFPSLLTINNMDKVLIFLLCGITFLLGLGISLIAQSLFIKKFYQPIDELQAHISKAIHGNFTQKNIYNANHIYCGEVLKTYNYFYSSLQANLQRDITFLRELEKSHEPDLAGVLINEKLEQLGSESAFRAKSTQVQNSSEDEDIKIAN